MDLIFYSASEDGREAMVLNRVKAIVPPENIVTCRTPQELSRNLMRPLNEVLAVVVFISDEDDLKAIAALKDVLHEIRLLLILPYSENGIVADGHSLRPRFVMFSDEQPEALVAVLQKVMRSAKQTPHL